MHWKFLEYQGVLSTEYSLLEYNKSKYSLRILVKECKIEIKKQ